VAVDWSQTGGVSVANLGADGFLSGPLALDSWTLQGLGVDNSGTVGGAGSSTVSDPLCPSFLANSGLCTPAASATTGSGTNPTLSNPDWNCAYNPLAACYWNKSGGPAGSGATNNLTDPNANDNSAQRWIYANTPIGSTLDALNGATGGPTSSNPAGSCSPWDWGCSLKNAFPNIQTDITALVTNAGWLILGIILVALGVWTLVKP
jgi:hypothetical protein